ncbi:DNA polymerase zeta catalytic subunit [Epargyreus clarus]|uniref:DNA polymerase zeta catalytic subunit n=1 Tax=Epargyreus clarus TaxID=520877 RepID=UPI003C2E4EB8
MERTFQTSDQNSYRCSSDKSSLLVNPEFSVRIVVCDHYLTRPVPGIDVIYSEFRGSNIKQVPVLRIFGSTPDGRKACLHVHGVFPYFYIPCPTPNPEPQFLYQIAASLDKALNIALKQATSANQHVYKISLVKGLPFYGFHDKEHLYLKIFLYNPGLIRQAVELCSNGAILGQTLQPHESHLNFTLQFFIDFNLFGMSNIDLEKVKFRKSSVSQKSNEPLDSPDEFTLKPESICYYEADCIASHIINRQRVGKGDGIENPGLEEVWDQELKRREKLNASMASKSLSQGRINSDETDSHYKFQNMFSIRISDLLDKPVNTDVGNAKHIEKIHYPAETLDDSQLFNATDVCAHLRESIFCPNVNKTLQISPDADNDVLDDFDVTIVNEDIAINSSYSLHYSQVPLDSEDLELVDILQDLDEKPIEDDSIMGTPANVDEENVELDDAEYSKVFDEDTLCIDKSKGNDHDNDSPSWDESFWEGATISQLDGTCDDECLKKLRKRKMRSFKLGLSKPKNKKETSSKNKGINLGDKTELENSNEDSNITNASIDEDSNLSTLNEEDLIKSRKIVKEDINCLNITYGDDDKMNIKQIDSEGSEIIVKGELNDSVDVIDSSINNDEVSINKKSIKEKLEFENESVTNLVNKHESLHPGKAASYDMQNKYEPIAGPSHKNVTEVKNKASVALSDSFDSSPDDDNLGIESFYDSSKLFDYSLDESHKDNVNPIEEFDDSSTQTTVISNIKKENITVINDQDNLDKSYGGYNITKNEVDNILILAPKIRPPSKSYIISTLDKYLIPKTNNPKPFYSDHKDVGDKVEIGQMVLKLHSRLARDQKPFEKVLNVTSIEEWRQLLFLQSNVGAEELPKPDLLQLLANNKEYILQPVKRAPTTREVLRSLEHKHDTSSECVDKTNLDMKEISKDLDEIDSSQVIGLNDVDIKSSLSLELNDKDKSNSPQVTMQPDGSILCFGNSENQEVLIDSPTVEMNFLTLMLVEVHTAVRGDLYPDPAYDAIQAIFITVTNESPSDHFLTRQLTQVLVVDDKSPPKFLDRCAFNSNVTYVNSEIKILEELIKLVQEHDPDIMCGYEMEMNSWGYVLERAQILGLEIVREISRITEKHRQKRCKTDDNEFEGKIIGRITFNVWRLFRYELALSSYSFENCMYEILKERVPKYSYSKLSEWWNNESRMLRWITVEYYLTKLSGTVRMLEKLDIINRTSELARLFGLQWWEVLSRGSQFRVESLMLRAARPLNLVALSPTVKQRAAMRAPECLPLIFEPESRFYTDPVIVLDFQSLYPSMMIAYNYCFSTCIGRVQNIIGDSHYEFGAWRLRIPKSKLEALHKNGLIHWSPVGVGFVKPSVRRGVLPALLRRILAARQAVKKGMKLQTDEAVKKAMHSRQLGLKLIANVTYGYTAANFSGRMPCVEVGDSVVAKGRETLERAIKLVRNDAEWNVKVVYGDTDSMFVRVPGGSRADAFRIGQQIADAVTADNPSPVALKLEKVYQPCILQTKKRYVGYMYESPDQEKPVYEAKGIETVRRDGCPAGVKLLQQSLCELFSTGDVSRVRRLAAAQLARLAAGALPPPELLFTREYHGAAGYRPGAAAPPNEIAKRALSRDRRSAPRVGERVSWVVSAGAPGAALVRLACTPHELLRDAALTPHVAYYATRVLLPPLHRCLSLLGVDVFKWWREVGWSRESGTGGIARYLQRGRCAACGARGARALCAACAAPPAAAALAARAANTQQHLRCCHEICNSCCGHAQYLDCENTECPVLWRRNTAQQKLEEMRDIITNLPPQFKGETFDF